MKRVTVIAHELRGLLPVGGMGTATTFLALALARMGHTVEILLGVMHRAESIDPYWDELYRRAGITIRAAPPSEERVEPWPFLRARSIELGLRENPPDVAIAHDFAAPAYTALRARQAGLAFADTAFVVFCHGSRRYALELSPSLAPKDLRHVLALGVLEQASVELADVVVSPSTYLLDWMRGAGWRLPERSLMIPYFTRGDVVDEPQRVVAQEDSRALERLAFFGRLDERKGIKVFAGGLNAVEPELLAGVEVEFIGKTTATWTRERVESLFAEATKGALRRIVFETALDQHEAIARLRRPGTLAVMPSLGENSPNTVYECLEHGIPFIASNAGGIPELIAPSDRERVLFEPTQEQFAEALRHALSERRVPSPPRPAFDRRVPFERWAEVVETRPERPAVPGEGDVDVIVVRRGSDNALARCLSALDRQTHKSFHIHVADEKEAGLRAGNAPFVVFLDEEDVPEPELLEALLVARAASDADAVSCGVRVVTGGESTLHFFSGEPGGLGLLANGYGSVTLLRRASLDGWNTPWAPETDADWPFLAGRTAAGARVVSIPAPLVTRKRRVGSVEDDPSDALLVAQALERALPDSLRGTARLAAGLAADAHRADDPGAQPANPLLRRVATALRRLSGVRR